MKKQILSIVIALASFSASYAAANTDTKPQTATANEKAVKNFNKQFKNATDVNMYNAGNGIIIRSEAGSNNVTAAYDKKGNWIYSIERYPSESLAKNILDIVKRSYDKYYVSGMDKIVQPGSGTTYIVYLENATSIKTLRITNNETELVQDFIKG